MTLAAIGLVVPVYDEVERFAEFGPQLLAFISEQPAGSELVFADDGSTDGTPDLVTEVLAAEPGIKARLLRLPHTGKGGTVAAGLRAVTTPYAGFCDVDLSTPLDQFERVANAAMRAPVLAIGSRDLAGSTLVRAEGPVREALGRAYNRLLQATLTPGIVDTQCGAKAASRELWARLLPFCHETGFAWDAELVAVASALDVEVQEVPIEWCHDDRSKVNVGRDGAAMVLATPRIWRRARAARATAVPVMRATVETSDAGTPVEVFGDLNAAELASADRSHWWFRSKAALVVTALRRTRPASGAGGWLIDGGAGAGGVTAMLGWDPERVVVVEGNQRLVRQARDALGLPAVQAHVDGVPIGRAAADVVCLLDVIEHLVDPQSALAEAARVLAPGGRLVVNVPAHEWLWSSADEHLGHQRRYTRASLRRELATAGFTPTFITHVFTWLVPFVWVQRRLATSGAQATGLNQDSVLVDRTAMVLNALERALVGRVSLPLGTSVLCVARRTRDA
jgi:SAM-dependent methyltransferase